MPLKIPYDKRLKASNLDAFFSQYADNAGPLESALGMAIARDRNAQLPSPAAPADPNMPATAVPKMDIADFNMPVGMGSWFNLSPQQREAWTNLKENKSRVDEFRRQNEQAQIVRLILTNPELAGQDPSAWDLKGIQAYLRQLKSSDSNPFKKRKDAAAAAAAETNAQRARLALEEKQKEQFFLNNPDMSDLYGQGLSFPELEAERKKRKGGIFNPPAVPGAAVPPAKKDPLGIR